MWFYGMEGGTWSCLNLKITFKDDEWNAWEMARRGKSVSVMVLSRERESNYSMSDVEHNAMWNMTFLTIESKKRPCLFLSNNVKNDVCTGRFYSSLVSPMLSQIMSRERKLKKGLFHLFKHQLLPDIFMEIMCSWLGISAKVRCFLVAKARGYQSGRPPALLPTRLTMPRTEGRLVRQQLYTNRHVEDI